MNKYLLLLVIMLSLGFASAPASAKKVIHHPDGVVCVVKHHHKHCYKPGEKHHRQYHKDHKYHHEHRHHGHHGHHHR